MEPKVIDTAPVAALVVPEYAHTVMDVIAQAARDPQTDPAKLALLFDLKERVDRAAAEKAFNQAMVAAQEEMRPVVKDSENPNSHSKYASLEKIDKAIRPIYTKHGFSLSFNSGPPRNAGAVRILCDVRHIEGFTKPYELEGDLDTVGAKGASTKTSIQGLGSSVSYLRRYLTAMIFNIALTREDNDGNGTKEAAALSAASTLQKLSAGVPYAEISKGNGESESAAVVHTRAGKKTAKHYDLLQAFRDLKKRFIAVNALASYYKCLGEAGYEHSNEFPDTPEGLSQARGCYKWMSLELAEIEAAAQQREESMESDRTDDSAHT